MITDRCRYCGATTDDAASGGPDDPAPGCCPTCLDERMGPLVLAALIRSADDSPDELKAWMRDELIKIGCTPAWAERFVEGDELAFALARERLA